MFKKVFVEITNRCNLACEFCPGPRRPKGDLAPAAFAGLLPQLSPFTSHLALHVLGEPLLHPQLDQLLALCHAWGFQVNLTTNGTLLPRQSRLLLAAPALRQVNISLHSCRGSGFAADTYLAGALDFARQAGAQGIYVSLRLWDLGGEPAADRAWGQEEVLARMARFFGLAGPLAPAVVAGQGIRLAERIFLSQKELFAWPTLAGPDLGGRGTCRGMRDQVAILVDGTVVPCCLDAEGEMSLGNVFSERFEEIVAGERAARISQGFRERKLVEELCRRCSYRERF